MYILQPRAQNSTKTNWQPVYGSQVIPLSCSLQVGMVWPILKSSAALIIVLAIRYQLKISVSAHREHPKIYFGN